MNAKVLVVGNGTWATRVTEILSKSHRFYVEQVSARDFINERSSLRQNKLFDIGVCATSPKLQEKAAPLLVSISKHLWLEKPISQSLHSGKELLANITAEKESYSLVNFSWLYSSVWNEFEGLNLRFGDIDSLIVRQVANKHLHKYMSAAEDYGSHDIALIYKWIISRNDILGELTLENHDEFGFNAISGDSKISMRINFGASTRSMSWLIKWKNGKETLIDFYRGRICHNGVELDIHKQDNIHLFVSALLKRDSSICETNHQIALLTKEFFFKS